ncbi:hypothetical protein [Brucella tritici]|uniref:hypothetical protein n=1 Tax=Brucella tritici TaxID=94626 RepID=UPI001AEF1806|nr:hypothetical protein [Brucella tritici]
MASELKPCPFCSKTMMLRSALWPSEGDADAIIHADPTDCPMLGFCDGSADGSIIEKWNCSLSNEDDFPSDGSCVRCGSVPRNANGLCNTCLDEDAERLENTRPAPAATDTGLETVEYQVRSKLNGHWVKDNFLSQQLSPDTERRELVTRSQAGAIIAELQAKAKDYREYSERLEKRLESEEVTRSQAAELLAAERAKKEMLAESLHIQIKRVNELEADNAAKDETIRRQDIALRGALLEVERLKADNAAKDARIKKAVLRGKL